jgi:hypothetical protein
MSDQSPERVVHVEDDEASTEETPVAHEPTPAQEADAEDPTLGGTSDGDTGA